MISQVVQTPTKTYQHFNTGGVIDVKQMAKDNKKTPAKVKAAALAGSMAATLGVLGFLAKKPGASLKFRELFKLDFDSPLRVILLATCSTIGGLTGGLLADKKEHRKAKIKEGIHQFLGNIITPISIVGITLSQIKKKNYSKAKEVIIGGIAAVAGVAAGVTGGNWVASKVNKVIFKENDDRKITAKDFGIHVDDIITVAALTAEGETIKNFISKALPAIFLICGYEAGTKSNRGSKH